MIKFRKLINESFAKSAAHFMKYMCYAAILFFLACTVLSIIGRQEFILHTSTRTYSSAIYAEENHDPQSRIFTTKINDDIRVYVDENGDKIGLATRIGLSAIYIVHFVPLAIGLWLLSRVFYNVSSGRIFTEQNSVYLLYYGLIQIAIATLVPLLKQFVCFLANQFAGSEISISTGQGSLNYLIPNIAFFVVAYILHYGVHLQDEADHTL